MKPGSAISKAGRVRVATFNLLAPCTTAGLRTNRPDCLPLAHRWPLLLKTLRRLMNKQCILLLQEVDAEIEAAGLYELLCTRGYVYMTASPVNGRHGSVLAYPTMRYQATELCKERVGLNVQRPPYARGSTSASGEALFREASARGRLMPWACLTDKQTLARFCVFGYHMICAFARPKLMALQLDAVLRGCCVLARGMPFILAGDFNMLPGSSLHRLATTGFADAECAPWPGFAVSPVTDPLARFPGLVTNCTPDFAGKIDYIFTSKEHSWRLTGFSIERFTEPAPNLLHGSDHVPVCCEFEISEIENSYSGQDVRAAVEAKGTA
jgi:endonuclease/exonuclease/phosphatase family metal-dependent hydrolase